MSFTEKVVIVTGASAGIGAAIAEKLAEAGASVVIVGRNEENLKNVLEKCKVFGDSHHVVKADISVESELKRIVEETIEKYGKIDVLVNNAGIFRMSPVTANNYLEVFDEVINTNLRPVVHLTTLAVNHLIASKGCIVNISSLASTKVVPAMNAYGTSKAALDRYSRGVALELAKHGVRVNVIRPGPVQTDIVAKAGISRDDYKSFETPLGRRSDSEEVADLVLYLASDKAVGVTGSVINLDNGLSLS